MGRCMPKIGFLKSLQLRWFIHNHRQVLRNLLSAEESFDHLSFQEIEENSVFQNIAVAHVNNELVHNFIHKFPTVYLHKGVLEWSDGLACDVYGTPGIYIKNVFDKIPPGVYDGYLDHVHGQLLFIPMYINVGFD